MVGFRVHVAERFKKEGVRDGWGYKREREDVSKTIQTARFLAVKRVLEETWQINADMTELVVNIRVSVSDNPKTSAVF